MNICEVDGTYDNKQVTKPFCMVSKTYDVGTIGVTSQSRGDNQMIIIWSSHHQVGLL